MTGVTAETADMREEPPFSCMSVAVFEGANFDCGGVPGHVGKHRYLIEWDGQGYIAAQQPQSAPAPPCACAHTAARHVAEGCMEPDCGCTLPFRGIGQPADVGTAWRLLDEARGQLQAVKVLMEDAAGSGIVDSRAILDLLADVPAAPQPARSISLRHVLGVLDQFTRNPEAAEKLGLGVIVNLRRRTGLAPADPSDAK